MRRLIAGACALLLASCSHNEPLALHGAASMRVEVEVYKGPLTSPPQGQLGELVGVLSDTIHATFEWREKALAVCPDDGTVAAGRVVTVKSVERTRKTTGSAVSDKTGMAGEATVADSRTAIQRESATERVETVKVRPATDPARLAACARLRSAIASAGDILGSSCFVLGSPTVKEFDKSVYIPVATCNHIQDAESNEDDFSAVSDLNTRKTIFDSNKLKQAYMQQVVNTCVNSAAKVANSNQKKLIVIFRCQSEAVGMSFDNLASILRGAADRAAADAMSLPASTYGSTSAPDPAVRKLLVEYATITAEYGAQIHSKITTLQRQLPPINESASSPDLPRDPKTLPVSDYLRSTSRTDYVQLYDWLDVGESGATSPADRIAVAQRLTADSYWQKVNEVYASGQGDVAMAFIKDELGNWDLKSFSNDPSDLLKSYRKVTDAALKTAASLATKAATGGAPGAIADRLTAAQKATSLANQLATGTVPATPGVVNGIDISALHVRTAERIEGQRVRFEGLQTRLGNEAAARDKEATAAANAKAENETKLTDARGRFDAAKGSRDAANVALQQRLNELHTKEAEAGADTSAEVKAVTAAEASLSSAQKGVDGAQTEVLKLEAAVAANEKAKIEADAKKAAADQRLADLPKEAIEAVRGTLDDHLAVVAALQDGIASSMPAGAKAPTATPGATPPP